MILLEHKLCCIEILDLIENCIIWIVVEIPDHQRVARSAQHGGFGGPGFGGGIGPGFGGQGFGGPGFGGGEHF